MPRIVRKQPAKKVTQRNGSNCLQPNACDFDRINDITMITTPIARTLKFCAHHKAIVEAATKRNAH